ncbi:hypothetical protein LPTSP3_g31080 [Leptospira kobayashii]|uniref:Uncharacterized protein n=1 Tax=Leptospira kobayashii TaxID=1917830 RepID=A0ABM7UMA0_9LEPT|nr:hypothetical protein [Leptospira kobayashii]BDA80178.1 hypothetical protein LPTSP3_g31080 [Leptospira kobayashii]
MSIDINKFKEKFKSIQDKDIEIQHSDQNEKIVILIFKYPNRFLPHIKFEDENLETIIRFRISKEENDKDSSLKHLVIEVNFWKKLFGENFGKYSDRFKKMEYEKYPLDMNFNEFSYDSFSDQIYLHNDSIQTIELINYILDFHFKITKIISGLPIRTKLYKKRFLTRLYQFLFNCLMNTEYILFGKKTNITKEQRFSFPANNHKNNIPQKKDHEVGKEIEILGISGMKIHLWDLTTFSYIQIIIFLISYKLDDKVFALIYNSALLSLFYVIIAFNLYSSLLRKILNKSAEFFWNKYTKLLSTRLEL